MNFGGATIEVVRGSVTDQPVDVIVNAANQGMRGGGGIDGRIHSLAGREMLAELIQAAPSGAKTGEPVLTGAYKLPQKFVIHVAGPRWRGGGHGEEDLLAACYASSLKLADEKGLQSIAFCSISTGIYGYPIEEAAPLALRTTAAYLKNTPETNIRRIVFALFGADEFDVFNKAYRRMAESSQE